MNLDRLLGISIALISSLSIPAKSSQASEGRRERMVAKEINSSQRLIADSSIDSKIKSCQYLLSSLSEAGDQASSFPHMKLVYFEVWNEVKRVASVKIDKFVILPNLFYAPDVANYQSKHCFHIYNLRV